jgi:hypothetical protein
MHSNIAISHCRFCSALFRFSCCVAEHALVSCFESQPFWLVNLSVYLSFFKPFRAGLLDFLVALGVGAFVPMMLPPCFRDPVEVEGLAGVAGVGFGPGCLNSRFAGLRLSRFSLGGSCEDSGSASMVLFAAELGKGLCLLGAGVCITLLGLVSASGMGGVTSRPPS